MSTPIMMVLMTGDLLDYAAIASPNATWLEVLSFLPPLHRNAHAGSHRARPHRLV